MKKILFATVCAAAFTVNVHSQCVSAFYDGFESATYTPTWALGPGLSSAAVTTTNPAVGAYRVEGTGGASTHLTGLSTTFTPATPNSMSWWIYPTGAAATNYVVAGDASVSATNCMMFAYWLGSSNVIRFVSSSTFQYPCFAGSWYFIEMRNINYTTHTFDIYINSVLMQTSFPFRSVSVNSISRVHLYNFNSGVGVWDDIRLGGIPPLSTASFTSPLCNAGSDAAIDQSVTSGTAPYTYAWSNGATTQDITGITAGTYSVVVTDAIGCMDTSNIVVTEPGAVGGGPSQTNVSCFGGNNGTASVIAFGGTGVHSYSWSPSGGTGSTETGLIAGSYTCVITDANACTGSVTVSITEPTQLMVAAANNGNVCPGDSATLIGTAMGGTSGYTYDWMPGNLSGSVVSDIPSTQTTYTLLVTDANGCTDTSTTTVMINVPPTVDLGPDTTVCLGMFLDAQNNGSTYLWNDSTTQQMLGVTATGTYFVTVTDINGCPASDTINVTIDSQPNGGIISSSGGVDVCPNDSVFLISVGDAGSLDWWVMLVSAPFWQNIGNGNPFTHGPVTLADTGMYQFMAIASNGVCPDDTSNIITVIVQVPPVVTLSDTATCGSSIMLDAGNPGSTYLWNDSTSQQQLTVAASGTYGVVVTDQFGCVGSDSANVTINPLPTVGGTASSNSVCQDDANVTLTGTPAGGSWGGPGVTGNSFDPSVGTGPQLATYTYTDSSGCTGNTVVTISVNACVGIAENSTIAPTVYPNPNDGTFYLSMGIDVAMLQVTITDLEGRVVYTSQKENVAGQNNVLIDLSKEAAGTYFMQINADGNQSTAKIVITK